MSNAPIQRGSWLVTLALAGGGLLYLFGSFLPNNRALRALRANIHSRQSFAAQTPALLAATRRLERELEQTKSFVAENRRRLPDAVHLPELASRMTRQADLAGARTTRFEPQAPKELIGLQILPVEFETQGSYTQICQMLAGMETLPERIWVDEIRIEPARDPGKSEQCILKLTVFAGNSAKSD